MKNIILALICVGFCNQAVSAEPYNYSLPVTNPFEAMKQGIELGKQVNTNLQPTYDKSGLPSNCRAFIQQAINIHRQGQYTAEDTLIAIERNCGINGHLW